MEKENEMLLLKDIVFILMEKCNESKRKDSQDLLEMGRHMAYYDVLSLIHQQAIAFGVDLKKIGMENYNPDLESL
jgi:hypothetical protein